MLTPTRIITPANKLISRECFCMLHAQRVNLFGMRAVMCSYLRLISHYVIFKRKSENFHNKNKYSKPSIDYLQFQNLDYLWTHNIFMSPLQPTFLNLTLHHQRFWYWWSQIKIFRILQTTVFFWTIDYVTCNIYSLSQNIYIRVYIWLKSSVSHTQDLLQ